MFTQPITCAFSGHRVLGGEEAEKALRAEVRRAVSEMIGRGYTRFLCGMAMGFDVMAGEVVLELRRDLPELRLVAVVPFEGQERRFPLPWRLRYRALLEAADDAVVLSERYSRGVYLLRNRYLARHASAMIAHCRHSRSGTAQAVRLAREAGLDIVELGETGREPRAIDF